MMEFVSGELFLFQTPLLGLNADLKFMLFVVVVCVQVAFVF